MLNSIIEFVALRLCQWCDRTGRTHFITGGSDELYLVRFIVLKTKYFSIFIHRFMRSDDPIPHDHPWNFLTYVISGGYVEQFFDRGRPKADEDGTYSKYWGQSTILRTVGSIRYRRANDIHYVSIPRKFLKEEILEAPLTVCLLGPRIKEWGFWVDDTTYVDWREFLQVRSNKDPRITGSE